MRCSVGNDTTMRISEIYAGTRNRLKYDKPSRKVFRGDGEVEPPRWTQVHRMKRNPAATSAWNAAGTIGAPGHLAAPAALAAKRTGTWMQKLLWDVGLWRKRMKEDERG